MMLTEGQMSDHKGAVLLFDALPRAKELLGDCKARYKNGPFPGLKRGQSLQTKSLDRGRGVIGVGEAAVA